MDIRKYFGSSVSKVETKQSKLQLKKKTNECNQQNGKRKTEAETLKSNKKRKRVPVIESDSDEDPLPTRSKSKSKNEPKVKSPVKKTPTKTQKNAVKQQKSPVKILNPLDFFGKTPIQRKKVEPSKKEDALPLKNVKSNTKKSEKLEQNWMEIDDDSEFEETLRQLDREICETEPPKVNDKSKVIKKEENVSKLKTLTQQENKDKNLKQIPNEEKNTTDLKITKKTPQKNNSTQSTDKELTRKSKSPGNVAKYLEYLNREGPRALGSKEIPEGEENCLVGLTFVITGVLESMERDDAADLIRKYGGKVTQSLSKKTNFLVVGRDAGSSKLEKAEKLNVKQIDEDGVLNLIATRKGNGKSDKSTSNTQTKAEIKIEAKENHAQRSLTKPFSEIEHKPSSSKSTFSQKSNTTPPTSSTSKNSFVDTVKPSPSTSSSTSSTKACTDENSLLWVDKYKPKSTKQIIGQQGDRSNANKLLKWLTNWQKNNKKQSGTKRKFTSSRWPSANDDGSSFKAALLSGPPGVGKTTTATLACQEVGLTFIELNASDTRSKRSLQEEVGSLLTNKSLTSDSHFSPNHCLIMDEVDGMAGNEDRGGVQELIQLIKTSKIPVICICNDRNHPKIRSLSNYCYDLRFQRPRIETLKGAMMSLCFKEKLNINAQALQEIITAAQQDVRQIIHHLALWSINEKSMTSDQAKTQANKAKKDVKLNPFDTLRVMFSASDLEKMNIHEKSDLFFFDYSIAPLFVQENYINMKPAHAQKNKRTMLNLLSAAADSICDGDLIDNLIRRAGNWNLLPVEAVFSSVIPGDLLKCQSPAQVSFPAWFGKNSRRNKLQRLSQELASHMRLKISANKDDVCLDYAPLLRDSVSFPLRNHGSAGIADAVSVMQSYDLIRDDWDKVIEVSLWPDQKDPMSDVDSKIKAAFTRSYNSQKHLIPYAIASTVKKSKKSTSFDSVDGVEDEDVGNSEDEVEDDSLDNDGMVKVKKSRESSAGSSRGRGKKGKKN